MASIVTNFRNNHPIIYRVSHRLFSQAFPWNVTGEPFEFPEIAVRVGQWVCTAGVIHGAFVAAPVAIGCSLVTHSILQFADYELGNSKKLRKILEALEKANKTLETHIKQLKKSTQELHKKLISLQEQLTSLKQENQEFKKNNNTLRELNSKLQEGNDTLKKSNQEFKESNDNLNSLIGNVREETNKLIALRQGNAALFEENKALTAELKKTAAKLEIVREAISDEIKKLQGSSKQIDTSAHLIHKEVKHLRGERLQLGFDIKTILAQTAPKRRTGSSKRPKQVQRIRTTR